MPTFRNLTARSIIAASTFLGSVQAVFAQNRDPGTLGGVPSGIPGASQTDPRLVIVSVLQYVLSFMALIAVIFIIVAGIRLIVSQGEPEQKDKAKKTIIYVVIGLIVILLAKAIVTIVTSSTQLTGG